MKLIPIERPIKAQRHDPSYDWDEIRCYLNEVSGRDLGDMLWCWIVDHYDVHNGCDFWLELEEGQPFATPDVKEAFAILRDAFPGESSLPCTVWW